jgi:hypothetical protein
MKKIELPYIKNIRVDLHKGGHYDGSAIMKEIEKRQERGMKVLTAVQSIELQIDTILEHTLFRELKQDRAFVSGNILKSDWCSFSAKRKLLNAVIEKHELVRGSARNDLDRDLSKTMRYRNALAHGTFHEFEGAVYLEYFQGAPKSIVLDDDYWAKLSKVLCSTSDTLSEILKAIIGSA